MMSSDVLVCRRLIAKDIDGKTVFQSQLGGTNLECLEGDCRPSLSFSREAFAKMLGVPPDVEIVGVEYSQDRQMVSFFLEQKK